MCECACSIPHQSTKLLEICDWLQFTDRASNKLTRIQSEVVGGSVDGLWSALSPAPGSNIPKGRCSPSGANDLSTFLGSQADVRELTLLGRPMNLI